jgi:site-specific DNA recombinase
MMDTPPAPRSRPKYQAPTLPRIAALYCRVSTTIQRDGEGATSLKTQRAALECRAAELGYAVVPEHVYEEAFNGEELLERPVLTKLREDARARKFGIVLSLNVYALAKNQAHLAILHDEWQRLGIGLDFVTEQLEDTPIGRAILALRAFAAEVEGERRKERFTRARLARVRAGRAPTPSRPNYGYQWADIRGADGRLTKERQVIDPVTAPIMRRVYEMMDTGWTLRGIAVQFTKEGIPTSTGKTPEWNATVVRQLLRNSIYCGRPMALTRKAVPVEKSVRHLYARRSRLVPRPIEEQIPLPPDYAPPIVSPEVWARVNERLSLNQRYSPRNNKQPANFLVRGLLVCGECGRRMASVNHTGERHRPRYNCPKMHSLIAAHKVDGAVWEAVTEAIRNPAVVAREAEYARTHDAPGDQQIADLDRKIAETERKIANKRKFAELVDDDDERAELAAEVVNLRQQLRTFEAERTATAARAEHWQAQRDGLDHVQEYCARVAGNLDSMSFQERRETLIALRTEIAIYKSDHTPRLAITAHLPLSGAVSVPMSQDGVYDMRLSKRR